MRKHVVEIGKTPAIAFEQRRHEALRAIELFSDDCFPERSEAVAAPRHDASLANPQAFAECGEGCRRTLAEPAEERGMLAEKPHGFVVHAGEAVADERRGPV